MIRDSIVNGTVANDENIDRYRFRHPGQRGARRRPSGHRHRQRRVRRYPRRGDRAATGRSTAGWTAGPRLLRPRPVHATRPGRYHESGIRMGADNTIVAQHDHLRRPGRAAGRGLLGRAHRVRRLRDRGARRARAGQPLPRLDRRHLRLRRVLRRQAATPAGVNNIRFLDNVFQRGRSPGTAASGRRSWTSTDRRRATSGAGNTWEDGAVRESLTGEVSASEGPVRPPKGAHHFGEVALRRRRAPGGSSRSGDMPAGTHVLVIVQNLPVPLDRRVWLECQALRRGRLRRQRDLPQGSGRPASRDHRRRPHPQVPAGAGRPRECSATCWSSSTPGCARRWLSVRVWRARAVPGDPGVQPAGHLLGARPAAGSGAACASSSTSTT